jgi:uncharacterized membrane protein
MVVTLHLLAVDQVRKTVFTVAIDVVWHILATPAGVIGELILELATTPNAGAGVNAHQS